MQQTVPNSQIVVQKSNAMAEPSMIPNNFEVILPVPNEYTNEPNTNQLQPQEAQRLLYQVACCVAEFQKSKKPITPNERKALIAACMLACGLNDALNLASRVAVASIQTIPVLACGSLAACFHGNQKAQHDQKSQKYAAYKLDPKGWQEKKKKEIEGSINKNAELIPPQDPGPSRASISGFMAHLFTQRGCYDNRYPIILGCGEKDVFGLSHAVTKNMTKKSLKPAPWKFTPYGELCNGASTWTCFGIEKTTKEGSASKKRIECCPENGSTFRINAYDATWFGFYPPKLFARSKHLVDGKWSVKKDPLPPIAEVAVDKGVEVKSKITSINANTNTKLNQGDDLPRSDSSPSIVIENLGNFAGTPVASLSSDSASMTNYNPSILGVNTVPSFHTHSNHELFPKPILANSELNIG